MATLESISVDLIQHALSEATTKSYNATLVDFQTFIGSIDSNYTGLPANPSHVILYIAHLYNKGLAATTILTKLSAISYLHKLRYGQDIMSHFLIEKCLSGVKKLAPTCDQRLPITVNILQRMITQCKHVTKSDYYKKLLQAMLSLGFYCFLRPGEMTRSRNNIQFQHVEWTASGLAITFTTYKHHVGSPVTVMVPAQGGPTCPVSVLKGYMQARGSSPGPLFINPDGNPVLYCQFKQWFSRLLEICSISGHFNPHSLRIGAATAAIAKGCSSSLVQQMGRWRSSAYLRYVRLPSVKLS